MAFRVKSAIIAGILLVSILSWPYVELYMLRDESLLIFLLVETHLSHTFRVIRLATRCLTSSSRLWHFIQSTVLSWHRIGTYPERVVTSPLLCSPFFTSILSIVQQLFTRWHDSQESSTRKQVTSLDRQWHTAAMQL